MGSSAPLRLWQALLAAGLSGALMASAYPAPGVWGAAFIAVAGLLLSLRGRSLPGALAVGTVYGAVLFLLLVSWTARYLGPLPWIALATVETAITAVLVLPITLAYRWVPRVSNRKSVILWVLPMLVAALWVLRENILGSWPYGGFPWSRIAMTQSEGPFAQAASWIGITGLSFAIIWVIAAVMEVIYNRSYRRPLHLMLPAAATLVILLLPLFPTKPAGYMNIAAVQGNGPTGYFDHREPFGVLNAQMAASADILPGSADLVVWPEGSLDYDPFTNAATAAALDQLSTRLNAPLLVNTATAAGNLYFNTSILWENPGPTDRDSAQLHDKRHPVPFGEYVPDRAFFAFLAPDLIGLIAREYSPGINPPTLSVGERTIGLAICFDVIYDDIAVASILGGAEVLVYQTNNADFRETDENLQQLAFARMRAIETGRSVVNVSTVGTSQIIRPDGSTAASLGVDTAGYLQEDVALFSGISPGILISPVLPVVISWGGLLLLLGFGLKLLWRRFNR